MDDFKLLEQEIRRLRRENEELSRLCGKKLSPTSILNSPNRKLLDEKKPRLFLCGPVYNINWQRDLFEKLEQLESAVTVVNPRRDDWEIASKSDIFSWEMEFFDKCNVVLFWFSWDHPNLASTLMLLGRCSNTKKKVFVGVHHNNKQKKVISNFVSVYHPHVFVAGTMEKLLSQVTYWVNTGRVGGDSSADQSTNSSVYASSVSSESSVSE